MATITYITSEFPPLVTGGVGNTARILANNFEDRDDLKINVITLRFGKYSSLKPVEKRGNITIYRIKIPEWLGKIYKHNLCFPFFAGLFSLKHRKLIKDSDILHSLHVRDMAFFFKANKPTILNVSDFYPAIIPFNPFKYPFNEKAKFLKYLHFMWFKILDRLSINKADAILCECNYAVGVIEDNYRSSKNKTHMIHKGIEIRSHKTMPKKEIDILFIGSRFEIKGAKEVVFAVNKLKKKYKNIKCFMIGKYSKFDYDYERYIKENGLEDNITIVGYVENKKVLDYLLKSRIYVIPTHLESLAQTTLEAMAAKLPVISSDVGGQPEAVTKDTGFLVKADDYEALAKHADILLSNPDKAKRMGDRGYEKVKNEFSEGLMIRNYLKIYNKFLSKDKKITS